MKRSTSENNVPGLRKKGKQITVQSISLTITVEGYMEGDTGKDKMETNTSKGNIHGIQITFYGNKSRDKSKQQRASCSNLPILAL